MHNPAISSLKMSLSLCVTVFFGMCRVAPAQTTTPGEWTWVGGSSSMYQVGIYGTQGTPSASNVPGSRSDSANWVDADGNLWMFGGFGVSSSTPWGSLSDLWKYDPTANQWTWMGGSNTSNVKGTYGTLGTGSVTNIPGARFNPASQTDKNGNFWLFGGFAVDSTGASGLVNDLWEFNPSTNEWTWMGGGDVSASSQTGVYGTLGTPAPSNIPGARESVASWVGANGKFWFFGGYQQDSQSNAIYLSDLWNFDPSTNEWSWMGGPQASTVSPGQAGVYGSLGAPASANIPGGRNLSSTWVDSSGNLWLFGGKGLDSMGTTGFLNDLWKFDPSTNLWTWMGGSYTTTSNSCSAGTYGTLGTPSASNLPGGRDGASVWTDKYGRFWMFGGYGCDSAGTLGNLGDLWMFDPSQNEWTWIDGSNLVNPTGTYGSLGVPAQNNVPGGRTASPTWTGSDGTQWLFGGYLSEPNNQFNLYTDLWAFAPAAPNTNPAPAVISSPAPNSQLTGTTVTFDWSAGTGVSFYSLWVGTSGPGSSNVYDSGNTTALSATVSNMPSGGLTVYVRLFSWINGAWQFNDYSYSTGGAPAAAVLTSPAPGSTLSGASSTFAWSSGTGVSFYSLWIGTKGPGSSDVLNSGNITSQSLSVTNLPNTGQLLYVRLFSWINGGWQSTDATYTASGTPIAAVLTSPTPGSTLPGPTATFSWTAGTGVSMYQLWIGTKGPGTSDVHNGVTPPTAQSITVTNLPENGQTLYVRLLSWINNAWQYHDYTFVAGALAPATITSPAPGSTFSGATATFTWSAGTGVAFYSLWVGTTGAGSSNLFNSGNTTAQTASVTDLPNGGQVIYVRLSSWIENAWQTMDYTYIASGTTAPAAMTSPVPGSTLSGTTVTFSWTAGVGVSMYALWIGTTGVGSSNVYNNQTTAQSLTVSNLPESGQTVYVRLFSWISGAWQTHDYTYTASVLVPAVITSPVPGSTLAGTTVTFNWSAGTGVSFYSLWVGTKGVGSNDLYNSGNTTALSATVSSLPTTGQTIYVRLFSWIDGAWQTRDFTFTAS